MLTFVGIICIGAILIALVVAMPFVVAAAYKQMSD